VSGSTTGASNILSGSPSMLNTHAKWRTDFARQIAKCLVAFEGVKAIVVAGSVARGYADEYSDIEIPLYWEMLPDDATRHAIVSALKGEFLYGYDGPACEDQLLVNGFQVDLWHIAIADEESTLKAVIHEHHFDLSSLNALDTIRCCIPLYGHEIVQKWKDMAQEYPNELAEQIIQEHIVSFSTGELFILAKRDNPTAFYARLSFLQQEIFMVLLALNRSYFPTFKWLYQALASMQVKPDAISERFRHAYQVSYQEAFADTKLILEETLHLVERQFPQMDTAQIYHHLTYARTAHEIPLNWEQNL
jgi:hypothetical protein